MSREHMDPEERMCRRGASTGVYSGGQDNSEFSWFGGDRSRGLDYSCIGLSHSEGGNRCVLSRQNSRSEARLLLNLEERRCLSSGAEVD
jgi:hypothetical protein